MKILTALTLVLAVAGLPAQEVPVVPPPEAGKKAAPSTPGDLVEALGSEDYATRSRATTDLRKMGEKARVALEKGLTSPSLERRTRARTLLDVLDQKGNDSADRSDDPERLRPEHRIRRLPRGLGGQDFESLRDLERTLERMMRGGRDPRGISDPFRDLRERLGSSTLRLNDGQSTITLRQDGETLELKRGLKGKIDLKVTSTDPGTGVESSQVFSAPDMDTFKKDLPGTYEKYKGTGIFSESTGGFSFTFGPFGRDNLFPDSVPGLLPPFDDPPGLKLGIVVGPVLDALRAHLTIPDRAVMVEDVSPGSRAESMNIRRFDIVTHVNDEPVSNSAEIQHILLRRGHPEILRVKILRKGQKLELQGEWPGNKIEKLKRK